MLDLNADHYCPVFERVIDSYLCVDSLFCLSGMFKVSASKELMELEDIEKARKICRDCPYSDPEMGMDEWDGNTD